MRIERIVAYKVDVPLKDGSYAWSEGKAVGSYDSTVLRIDTDEGVSGWAEICPLDRFIYQHYAEGGVLES